MRHARRGPVVPSVVFAGEGALDIAPAILRGAGVSDKACKTYWQQRTTCSAYHRLAEPRADVREAWSHSTATGPRGSKRGGAP